MIGRRVAFIGRRSVVAVPHVVLTLGLAAVRTSASARSSRGEIGSVTEKQACLTTQATTGTSNWEV
jgi:hypothetical protein